MFWKKSRALVNEIEKLVTLCEDGLQDFERCMSVFYTDGDGEDFGIYSNKVKEWESQADNQVFRIKQMLFGNFLLPESREDIARLLNKIDNIIDNAMHATKYIALRKIEPVPELAEFDSELRVATLRCFDVTREAGKTLFEPHQSEKVRDLVEEIGKYESICDEVQDRMVAKLYDLDMDEGLRIIHTELIHQVGSISDACEDAGAIMGIMNLKRVI